MTETPIKIEHKNKVAVVTLNRPDKKNAFDLTMWQALEETVQKLKEKLPRAIVITGEGKDAFTAGFDVNPAILENWEEHTGLLMRKYEGKPEFEESFFHID